MVTWNIFALTEGRCVCYPSTCSELCRYRLDDGSRYLPQDFNDVCAIREVNAHGEPMTLDEVGRRLGVTQERSRQIEAKALQHIITRAERLGLDRETLREVLNAKVGVGEDLSLTYPRSRHYGT